MPELSAFHRPHGSGPSYWGPGDLYTFLVTGEESGGEYFSMLAIVPPDGGPPPRPRPGSYSWAELRREAEERWASGDLPGPVIEELRAREAPGRARPPSRPTMYRWWREGRWRAAGARL